MTDQHRLAEEYARDYMGKIFYYCLRKTGDSHEAEDLASDITLQILTALHEGVEILSFPAWVWQIARNRYALWAKTNRRRGGFVENVWVEDLEARTIKESVLNMTTKYYYQWAVFPDYELRYTTVRNINIRNVRAACADWVFDINADEMCPADGFRFENIRLESARKGFMHIVNAKNVEMKNVTLGDGPVLTYRKMSDWVPTGAPIQEFAVPESEKKRRAR